MKRRIPLWLHWVAAFGIVGSIATGALGVLLLILSIGTGGEASVVWVLISLVVIASQLALFILSIYIARRGDELIP